MKKKGIRLQVPCVDASEDFFYDLETRGLIRPFLTRGDVIKEDPVDYRVMERYRAEKSTGSHMLIKVCFNLNRPSVGWHGANEDFILVKDPEVDFKDLFLIIAMGLKDDIQKKIENKSLKADDFKIVRMVYNNPFLSFFTMNAHVPHCELTVSSSRKAPEFFVTEPSRVGNTLLDLKDYQLEPVMDTQTEQEGNI
ncbi:hypothetical protein [Marispirochaeta aestuarii]|uniref:hypothetical protein n=1 Tax=Marispirochaeta aestuarii TaxID=1963862 RepID=UPI002ABD5C62|nr:hypothetical protein [Marispirochaeta aestuarii]